MLSIKDYLESKGIEVKVKANGEHCCACPFPDCSSKNDGFFWSFKRDREMFYCRKCGRKGDICQLIQDLQHVSFKEAKLIAEAEKSEVFSFALPKKDFIENNSEYWQTKAEQFVKSAAEALQNDEKALAWLLSERGITKDTAKKFKLGVARKGTVFNNFKFYANSESLVMPAYNYEGKLTSITLKYFTPSDQAKRFFNLAEKGKGIKPCVYGEKREGCIIVESQLDAILIAQEVGELITPIALIGMQTPLASITDYIKSFSFCLASLDGEDNTNEKTELILDTFPDMSLDHRKPFTLTKAKDPTELFKKGYSLKEFVEAGIKYFKSHSNDHSEEKTNKVEYLYQEPKTNANKAVSDDLSKEDIQDILDTAIEVLETLPEEKKSRLMSFIDTAFENEQKDKAKFIETVKSISDFIIICSQPSH